MGCRSAMSRIFSIIMVVVIGCLGAFLPALADDETDKSANEYRIKIAFIYNFLKFVDWPGDNAPKKSNVATVCITGDKEFSSYFKTFQESHTQSLTININDSASGSVLNSCNILFIGKNQEDNAHSILAYVKHHPVLSISEAKDFADEGGSIEIVRVGKSVGLFYKDKINLRINARTAAEDGLTIDARLLQIAAEVIK